MNVAHPFREGNGRSMRLWLEQLICELNFFKEIDASYHYEGYNTFKTEDL